MELFNYTNDKIEPQKGDLLISEPFLMDPNFVRTVIFLCEHNEEGSFGFVLNKPASIKLNELFEGSGNTTEEVFIGGPVQQNTLQFIHRNNRLLEGGTEVKDGIYWGGNFEQMLAMLEGNLIKKDEIKFFVGYSGWAAGQLKMNLKLIRG